MYNHIVQYYETDKMGVTHHSNYIRWMEEARIAFLAENGWEFAKLEEMGIISPVVSVNCKYKTPTVFSEVVAIEVSVEEYKGVKLKLKYIMKNTEGKIVCEAQSEHCFLNEKGRPIRMAKEFPELHQALLDLAAKQE